MTEDPPFLVVMGVSGSGKSTLGAALARRLQVPFLDGDDLHPPENLARMAAGEPLEDADRQPWLHAIGRWLAGQDRGGVVSCSALRRSYRDRLRSHAPGLRVVHLTGDPDLIAARQADRPGHFMPTSLMRSQLSTLEPLAPDEDGIVLDVEWDAEILVDEVVAWCAAGG
jgi:gluconokinase